MENTNYAGFWIRLAALLIDVLVLLLVVYAPLYFIYGDEYINGEQLIHGVWDVLLTYILPFVVTIWLWLRYFGTPGKILLKLKVVDANSGQALSLGQAIGRYFAYILAGLPLGLGLFWIAFDKRKQGWHDKLAGSVVVRGNVNAPGQTPEV